MVDDKNEVKLVIVKSYIHYNGHILSVFNLQMKMKLVLFISIFSIMKSACAITDMRINIVNCEGYGDCHYSGTNCCLLKNTSAISSENVKISVKRGLSLVGINMHNNPKIQFLPVNIASKFPNISRIEATDCRIEKVSKINFKGLFSLWVLYLDGNLIEEIKSDTFEDLSGIKFIHLGK